MDLLRSTYTDVEEEEFDGEVQSPEEPSWRPEQSQSTDTKRQQIAVCSSLLSGDYSEWNAEGSQRNTVRKKDVYSSLPVTHKRSERYTKGFSGAAGRYVSKRERSHVGTNMDGSRLPEPAAASSGHTLTDVLACPPVQLATYMSMKRKVIVNTRPSAVLAEWGDHTKAAMCAHWHKPNGQLLLSASMDGSVCLWEPFQRRTCLRQWRPHGGCAVRAAAWFYDGVQVLSGGYDNNACLNDAETGTDKCTPFPPP